MNTYTQLPLVNTADALFQYFNYTVRKTAGCRIQPNQMLYLSVRRNIEANARRVGWDQMVRLVDKCASNDFLNGRAGRRPFIANLYWIMLPETCDAILSGRYDNLRIRPEAYAQQCRDEAQARQAQRIQDLEAGRGGLRIYLQRKLEQGLPLSEMDRQRLAILSAAKQQ